MDNLQKAINDLIIQGFKAVRKERGLSQTGVAKRLGVTPSHISMLESRKAQPSDQLIKNFCSQFEINEEWLRTGKGPKEEITEEGDLEGGILQNFKITDEMIEAIPELRYILLPAEECDREGFYLQMEYLIKRRKKEKGDQASKWDGVERREGTKKAQTA